MRRYLLFLLCLLALLSAASARAAPTSDAGDDLTVTPGELGGLVLHGTVMNASYYTWLVWDGTQYLSPLPECDAPVGPSGEADVTFSAGQLAPGQYLLWLVAKTQKNFPDDDWPDGEWQLCGESAWDSMVLTVAYPGSPSCEAGDDLTVNADELEGYVIHGSVSNAGYYTWGVYDGPTCIAILPECDTPAGPGGEADLTFSAGQLAPGQYTLWLVAKTHKNFPNDDWPDGQWSSCGESAWDSMTLLVCSPDPVIQSVSMCRGYLVDQAGAESYEEHARAVVTDCDGWRDVWVCTVAPGGGTHPSGDDCNGSFNEGPYTLNWGWGQWTSVPLQAGAFSVVACDSDGDSTVFVTDSIPAPPSSVPSVTHPFNGEMLPEWETLPTFQWDPVAGASGFEVWVEDAASGAHIWQRWDVGGDQTGVTYDGDPLSPGHVYRLQVRAWYPDQDPSTAVSAWLFAGRMVEFTIFSPVPQITRFEVQRGRGAAPDGTLTYQQFVKAFVTDPEGTDTVEGVTFTDSQGQEHAGWFICQWDETTAVYCWQPLNEEYPSPAGTYTATAIDQDGNTASASAEVSAIPEDPGYVPAIESPPANSSIAPDPPVFAWSAPLGEGCYCLRMREVDAACAVWCPPGPVSSPFTYDGTGNVLPGHLYGWDLHSWVPDNIEQTDPRAMSGFWFTGQGRFWLEPKFIGFLEPINNDGSSIFKLNSTVPVKFQLLNADGSYKGDSTATLSIAKVENEVLGKYLEMVNTAAPDGGSIFRYDPAAKQYIFNLGTRNLSLGTYSLQVTVDGVVAEEVLISLK